MLKKAPGIILITFLLMMTGGCVSSRNVGLEQPQVTIDPAVTKPLENFNQLTEAAQKAASEDGAKKSGESNPNKEDLEMKHWKYNRDNAQANTQANTQSNAQANANNVSASQSSSGGTQGAKVNQSGIKNYSADNGDGLPATIQLLTEEDLQMAVNQLVKLGYLSGNKVTENDFNEALIQFQNAQKLSPSGFLDKETLKILSSSVELVNPK
ncbi:MAG: hypothetical protein CVU90_07290 [Firmicutes bacterium HGW-Firmicutes-15]|nr:MAG: hypothetical protein CVU90_07290 [Firmicutes bacterium HGW-Firmicutes-15]